MQMLVDSTHIKANNIVEGLSSYQHLHICSVGMYVELPANFFQGLWGGGEFPPNNNKFCLFLDVFHIFSPHVSNFPPKLHYSKKPWTTLWNVCPSSRLSVQGSILVGLTVCTRVYSKVANVCPRAMETLSRLSRGMSSIGGVSLFNGIARCALQFLHGLDI